MLIIPLLLRFFFQDTVSLCSPAYPGFVDQAGLELRDLSACCLLNAGIKGLHYCCPATAYFFDMATWKSKTWLALLCFPLTVPFHTPDFI